MTDALLTISDALVGRVAAAAPCAGVLAKVTATLDFLYA